MFAHGAGHGDPQAGLRLREVKHVRAVREHGGAGFSGVEPAVVHLGDVVDEIRLDATGITEQRGQATEEVVVRDLREATLVLHGPNVRLTQDREGPNQKIVADRTRTATRCEQRRPRVWMGL